MRVLCLRCEKPTTDLIGKIHMETNGTMWKCITGGKKNYNWAWASSNMTSCFWRKVRMFFTCARDKLAAFISFAAVSVPTLPLRPHTSLLPLFEYHWSWCCFGNAHCSDLLHRELQQVHLTSHSHEPLRASSPRPHYDGGCRRDSHVTTTIATTTTLRRRTQIWTPPWKFLSVLCTKTRIVYISTLSTIFLFYLKI